MTLCRWCGGPDDYGSLVWLPMTKMIVQCTVTVHLMLYCRFMTIFATVIVLCFPIKFLNSAFITTFTASPVKILLCHFLQFSIHSPSFFQECHLPLVTFSWKINNNMKHLLVITISQWHFEISFKYEMPLVLPTFKYDNRNS